MNNILIKDIKYELENLIREYHENVVTKELVDILIEKQLKL